MSWYFSMPGTTWVGRIKILHYNYFLITSDHLQNKVELSSYFLVLATYFYIINGRATRIGLSNAKIIFISNFMGSFKETLKALLYHRLILIIYMQYLYLP